MKITWGRSQENGIWRVRPPLFKKRYKSKILWRNHDSLYIAVGRWRLRLMKPEQWR